MQQVKITLAQEKAADWWDVEALYDLCFVPGRTALSSYRLREDVAPIHELCTVARDPDGVLAGALRCWPVLIDGKITILLGPIAVHPTRQGEGIAALLMMHTIGAAKGADWARLMLIGDLPFYKRFGFFQLEGIEMPPPTNPERVLGVALKVGGWDGIAGDVARMDN